MKLPDSLVITEVTYFREEDQRAGLKITPGSKAVMVTWDETNPVLPGTMGCVELYDQSKNKHFLLDMRGQLLTMVHRFRMADEVTLIEDLNLMHDGVKM